MLSLKAVDSMHFTVSAFSPLRLLDPVWLGPGGAVGSSSAQLAHTADCRNVDGDPPHGDRGIVLAVMAGSAIADFIWFQAGRTVRQRGDPLDLQVLSGSCLLRAQDGRYADAAWSGRAAAGKVRSRIEYDGRSVGGPEQDEVSDFLLVRHGWDLLMGHVRLFWWEDSLAMQSAATTPMLHWLGRSSFVLVVLVVVGILIARLVRQRRFLRKIRTLRIEPTELKAMMDRGDNLYIIDLRHPLDILPDPRILPGAVCLPPNELIARNSEIPRDRDIVLYCTCPSEATSAKVALTMRRFGIERIRPLRGGFDGWKDQGYPLVEISGSLAQS